MYLGKIVEVSPAEELYDKPIHPYTVGAAGRDPDPRSAREPRPRARRSSRASRRRPIDPPPGCRFHTRCPHATEVCRAVEPPAARRTPAGTSRPATTRATSRRPSSRGLTVGGEPTRRGERAAGRGVVRSPRGGHGRFRRTAGIEEVGGRNRAARTARGCSFPARHAPTWFDRVPRAAKARHPSMPAATRPAAPTNADAPGREGWRARRFVRTPEGSAGDELLLVGQFSRSWAADDRRLALADHERLDRGDDAGLETLTLMRVPPRR